MLVQNYNTEYAIEIREETNMTIIFITHDIRLAYYISDVLYIMEHGKFVKGMVIAEA